MYQTFTKLHAENLSITFKNIGENNSGNGNVKKWKSNFFIKTGIHRLVFGFSNGLLDKIKYNKCTN